MPMPDNLKIHPERLASKPIVFTGSFVPAQLGRLRDALADDAGELRYRITAYLDRQRRKIVWCTIEGFVFLTCQATLEPFRHEVSIADRLVLVGHESELPAIEEESDAEDHIVADRPLDIGDLVEDAVLLALPMVPRKPGEEGAGREEALPGQSPFAVLAGLKRRD